MTTKEKVLNILTEASGQQNGVTSVSGEKLAEICGVSRAAVWKAVNALRESGCNIEGTTNGGYVLKGAPDIFSKEILEAELKNAYPDFSNFYVECFTEIDSTNTYAKKVLSAGEEKYRNSIIVAESQTAGRGRLGRTFYSPGKTGIYLSIVYSPDGGIQSPAKVTAFSAVAVKRVLERLYNIKPEIKWINDIFAGGKKISGILTEGFTNFETGQIDCAIIGIGINISDNPQVFPPEVAKIAGSIKGQEGQGEVSRCKLAAYIAGEVLSILSEPQAQVLAEYKAASFLLGQTITVHPVIGDDRTIYEAKVVDIDDQAGLVVELPDGTKRSLSSGEVSLHGNY